MRHCGRWLLVSVALAASPASAKDLKRLSELIVPSYTAMTIAVLCTHDDPSFAAANTSLRGTALHYAQHAKDEATEGLTYAEAEEVLKGAADVAWGFARKKLLEIANPFDQVATERAVKAYCDSDGKAAMLHAMIEYDRTHAIFVENLREAKALDKVIRR